MGIKFQRVELFFWKHFQSNFFWKYYFVEIKTRRFKDKTHMTLLCVNLIPNAGICIISILMATLCVFQLIKSFQGHLLPKIVIQKSSDAKLSLQKKLWKLCHVYAIFPLFAGNFFLVFTISLCLFCYVCDTIRSGFL